jgi:hypothetical protein
MQMFTGLTIAEVAERQFELFERVDAKMEAYSREDNCYVNCMMKIERDGGEVTVGWRKDPGLAGVSPIISILTHHAVWKSPQGALRDITPQRRLRNGKWEILSPNFVDFMPDPAATFDDLQKPRDPVHIPSAPDLFGNLKEACIRMDRRWALVRAEDWAKIPAEEQEISRLVTDHMTRIR